MAKVNRSYEAKQRESYRDLVNDRDEAYQWLQWHQPAKDWMGPYGIVKPTSVHHIHGRGSLSRYHWYCNLICVSDAPHRWCHDVSPHCFELCCLRAKMAAEQTRISKKKPVADNEQQVIWNPPIMALNIGRDSLAGRIDELLAKDHITGTVFERYGSEIISFLSP